MGRAPQPTFCSRRYRRAQSGSWLPEPVCEEDLMVTDLLLAALITAVAVVLGVTIHPLLFLLIVLAIIWLFMRRAAW